MFEYALSYRRDVVIQAASSLLARVAPAQRVAVVAEAA